MNSLFYDFRYQDSAVFENDVPDIAHLNTEDYDGNTPLILAISYKNLDSVHSLLDAGADVNFQTSSGISALMVAVIEHDVHCMRELLNRTADPNLQDVQKNSALMFAVQEGASEICTLLLNSGADMELSNVNGETAFMLAADLNDIELLTLLLDYGANIQAQDLQGRTPLMRAVINNNLTLIEFLLDRGADYNIPNSEENSPLMLATKMENEEACRLLIQYNAHLELSNRHGETALMLAARNSTTNILDILLAQNPNLEAINHEGRTALIIAICANNTEAVKKILKYGANANVTSANGRPALADASLHGNAIAIQALIDHGAALHVADTNGQTALLFARYFLKDGEFKAIQQCMVDKLSENDKNYFEFYKRTKEISNRCSIAGTSRHPLGATIISFQREGLAGKSSYFSKSLLKNIRTYIKENSYLLPPQTSSRIEKVLQQHYESTHTPAKDLAKIYLDEKALLISTGYSEHHICVLLWHGHVLLINRGNLSRKPLEIFRLTSVKNSDPLFVEKYITKFHDLQRGKEEEYGLFIDTEFSSHENYVKRGWLEEELEQQLALPQQTTGNCPWASLEGAFLALLALEEIGPERMKAFFERKEPLPSLERSKRLFQNIIAEGNVAAIDRYIEKIPKDRQEEDILQLHSKNQMDSL